MSDVLLAVLHLAVVGAKLCGAGGVRAVIAENLLLKQQLIVLRRRRQRAPGPRDRRPQTSWRAHTRATAIGAFEFS
jgi:hypothetical protein